MHLSLDAVDKADEWPEGLYPGVLPLMLAGIVLWERE